MPDEPLVPGVPLPVPVPVPVPIPVPVPVPLPVPVPIPLGPLDVFVPMPRAPRSGIIDGVDDPLLVSEPPTVPGEPTPGCMPPDMPARWSSSRIIWRTRSSVRAPRLALMLPEVEPAPSVPELPVVVLVPAALLEGALTPGTAPGTPGVPGLLGVPLIPGPLLRGVVPVEG